MTITRVLHCIPTLESGGAERQLAYLARSLKERGVEIHIACLRGGANLDRARASGATIHFLAHRGHHDPALLLRLLRLMDEVRPDVVQTWVPQMDVLGGLAALWRGIPLVVSERSSATNYPANWKNRLRQTIGRRAACIVANSEVGGRYWTELGPLPVTVVRNLVPVPEIEAAAPPSKASLGLEEDAELILFVGRYSWEKNLSTLVAGLCKVLAARPRAVCLLHGEGPERDGVIAQVEAAGMAGRIRVGGFTRFAWGLMKSAAAFVSVSDFEGNPNAVLEAAACRCPLVVSDIPAHREILDASRALLVPARSAEAIAAALCAVLDDPAAARRRAESAAQAIGVVSGSSVVDAYLQIYDEIAGPGIALPRAAG